MPVGTVIDLDRVRRDCVRCGFNLPITEFPQVDGVRHRQVCAACVPGEVLFLRVALLAADGVLRSKAVAALFAMSLSTAATAVLRGGPWPRLPQARAMQQLPRRRKASR